MNSVMRGLRDYLGCPDPTTLGQFDLTVPELPTDTLVPEPPTFAYDPAWAMDVAPGDPSIFTALPDGTVIDMLGADVFTDPFTGMDYQQALDGTQLFADGTVIKPDGDIMTPGGTVVHPDGSMTLTNGDSIPAATPMPDGATTIGDTVMKLIGSGLTVAAATLTTLQKLGITPSPPRHAGTAASTGWVSGTQYKTASGAIVTPTKLSNGLYQLPDGAMVGAPSSSGFGFGMIALIAAGAFLLLRR